MCHVFCECYFMDCRLLFAQAFFCAFHMQTRSNQSQRKTAPHCGWCADCKEAQYHLQTMENTALDLYSNMQALDGRNIKVLLANPPPPGLLLTTQQQLTF